ncbi:MAG: hypothetical protein JKY70_03360 [Mucilaginibacter sp.]|nr:hypothetical protein [Mucilaginibacter sp.]
MQTLPTYIIISVCAIAATVFAVLEIKRRNKAHLAWRLAAVLIAIAALACIALPLRYDGNHTIRAEKKTVLLTAGFNADSISTDSNTRVYTLNGSIKKAYPKAALLSGLDELTETKALHIYGDGLKLHELAQLDSLPVVFHPPGKHIGVISASWNEKLKAGENLHVQGIYNNTSTQKVKLVLKGLATNADSLMLAPKSETRFSLSAKPAATGPLVYQLYADTALQGDVPTQVEPAKPLRVLMLSASPDFETKFLKNWLGSNGYAVAMRAAISKNKYNTEFINLPQTNIGSLSASILNKFDVVIGDLSALASLTGSESSALKQQITDGGLGIIVRADSTDKRSWLQTGFVVDRPSGKEAAPSFISISNQKSRSGKLLTGNAHLSHQNGIQPLASAGNKTLAAVAQTGVGKIIFTTINNSYSWMLGGDKEDYASFWSAMIGKAARKADDASLKISFASLPVAGAPVILNIERGDFGLLSINKQPVSPEQNLSVPFAWAADGQINTAGWQTLQSGNTTANWYAYPANQWRSVQSSEKINATRAYAVYHPATSIVTEPIHKKVRIDVPKIYFYILLLAACTFLWIEAKRLT